MSPSIRPELGPRNRSWRHLQTEKLPLISSAIATPGTVLKLTANQVAVAPVRTRFSLFPISLCIRNRIFHFTLEEYIELPSNTFLGAATRYDDTRFVAF